MKIVDRNLDPSEALLELLFGLIMAFTLTAGARLVYDRASFDPMELVIGLIGCNVAWGVIDAAFYMIGSVFNRNRRVAFVRRLQATTDTARAIELIREEFDFEDEPELQAEDRAGLHRGILQSFRHAKVAPARLRRGDFVAAGWIVLLVSLTALPAAVPLLVMTDGSAALKLANYLQTGLLFGIGFYFARYTGARPWLAGGFVAGLCTALVVVAVLLGG